MKENADKGLRNFELMSRGPPTNKSEVEVKGSFRILVPDFIQIQKMLSDITDNNTHAHITTPTTLLYFRKELLEYVKL